MDIRKYDNFLIVTGDVLTQVDVIYSKSVMLCSVTNANSANPLLMLIQEFVSFSEGRDLCVMVIDGRVVGAMQHTATDGDFKANISQGGDAAAFSVDHEMEKLALDVAKTLDLDIDGID
eukprot:3556383-Ditylum_brightwellii.AAC.1